MCILFIALKQHPKFPVIICANRDEFHQRPTQNLHVWSKEQILAGKDLQAGGTWLGITKSGHFSALTNFRQPHLIDPAKTSRGDLVIKALAKKNIASKNKVIQQHLKDKSHEYNGFNLLYGNLEQLYCFDSVNKQTHVLNKGIYSVCNGAITDSWSKMQKGQQALAALLNTPKNEEKLYVKQLFSIMQNSEKAPSHNLPNTGLSEEREALLSSIFITSPNYGTRSTVLITKDIEDKIEINEVTYLPSGEIASTQCIELNELFSSTA